MPGPNAFPKSERILQRSNFQAVFRRGERHVGREFICYVARWDGQGRKIGFAVSRKVGGAVVRNRVKRHLREFYRTHRSELVDDAHIVVVAKPAAAKRSFDECSNAMRKLLKKGGALRGHHPDNGN